MKTEGWVAAQARGIGCMLVCCLALVASGCQKTVDQPVIPAAEVDDGKLSILASTEFREFETSLIRAAALAGVEISLTYAGVGDFLSEASKTKGLDAVMPVLGSVSSEVFGAAVVSKQVIFTTSAVVAVKSFRASELGWDTKTPSWQDIALAAKEGKFRYSMGHPQWSSSGYAALASAVSSRSVESETGAHTEISMTVGQELSAGAIQLAPDIAWLGERFVRENALLDGMVASEADAMRVNGQLPSLERLVLVYPSDGSIAQDYSILLLNRVKQPSFQRFAASLADPRIQAEIVKSTYLRPVNESVKAAMGMPAVNPKIKESRPIALLGNSIGEAFAQEWGRASTTFVVVPAGASAVGSTSTQIRDALRSAVGLSAKRAGGADEAMSRDKLILVPYGATVGREQSVAGPDLPVVDIGTRIDQALAAATTSDGDTGVFDAVLKAQHLARKEMSESPDRSVSVVAFMAQENSAGLGLYAYQKSQGSAGTARVYPVLVKMGNQVEADAVASATGGRVIDARRGDLSMAVWTALAYR